MTFTWNTFIKPISQGDKSLKIADTTGLIKWTINPYSVVNAYVYANILNISLSSGKKVEVPFSSLNESKLALERLKFSIDNLKQNSVPLVNDKIKNYVQSLEPQFFFQSTQPTGTGTNAIKPGSFWYDTTDGTLYIYVEDDDGDFTWTGTSSQSQVQFFYQETTPTGTGTNAITPGTFWYDTTDGTLYIYVQDSSSGDYYFVTASTSFSTGNLFEFFYQDTSPEGTGTGEIPTGSLWFDTEEGILYVYVRDGNSEEYNWVTSYGAVGPQGPVGATGPSGDLEIESLITLGATSSEVIYDFSVASTWYHPVINLDYLASFVNLPQNGNSTIKGKVIIEQGTPGYLPQLVKLDGATHSIKWIGGTASATQNGIDLIDFTFIRISGTYSSVLGDLSNFF